MMNYQDVRRAMLVIHPTIKMGRDYIPRIVGGEIEFPVWKNGALAQPTMTDLIAAVPDHAPSVQERLSTLEENIANPFPVPGRPEWWASAGNKFNPNVVGKPEHP